MKKLIINADDFGIHSAVNAAVEKAFREGVLTSATLVACGAAYEQAVDVALDNPGLGVGIHLTLVSERPLLKPEKITSLVTSKGIFFDSYIVFLKRFVCGAIRLKDIEAELRAQIERMLDSNVKPDHLDSHQHLHVFPCLSSLVARLANEYNIPAVRLPQESLLFKDRSVGVFRYLARNGLSLVASGSGKIWRRSGIAYPDAFYGMLYGGAMNTARLRRVIGNMPDGTSEIMVHPALDNGVMNDIYGWRYAWSDELQALITPEIKNSVMREGIELVNFGSIVKK